MDPRITLHTSLTLAILVASSSNGQHLKSVAVNNQTMTELHLKMDQALLTLHNQLTEEVQVFYTSDYCYKCVYQRLATVKPNNNTSAVISTKFTLTLRVETHTRNETLCRWSHTYGEGGHYSLWIQMSEAGGETSCAQTVDKSPNNVYLHKHGTCCPLDFLSIDARRHQWTGNLLSRHSFINHTTAVKCLTDNSLQLGLIALLVFTLLLAIITILFNVGPSICRSNLVKTICCQGLQYSLDDDGGDVGEAPTKAKPTRLRSLDTFRGFALTVMVFVNYGGGGYWFFQHAPWNGLTVADLVMPWFVFIIGTSVVLAFRSMQRRGVGRMQLLRKITWRTGVLVLLGFCFLNYSPRDGPLSFSWLRIPGVLQRLGFTYFILALLQTFWGQKEVPLRSHHWWDPVQDVVLYWPQWVIIILLETVWLCVTFLMPVPNCPTGYLGAGGIGDNGLYPNCTGGAAGYTDRLMFGDNMYRYPTCKEMYLTTQPFDPEGVLGTINSIVMGFLGMQAGKIIISYKGFNIHILGRFLAWAVVLGISAAILSKCTRDGGFIPVNKNLWSLSYVTCMGCFSFLLLAAMYFVSDVKGWWGGQPFIYPGMNSIFVYVGHSLLGFYFPFSWEMNFQQSHWEQLFQSLWGTGLWVLIAYLLYRKKFFLKI